MSSARAPVGLVDHRGEIRRGLKKRGKYEPFTS
jgi:hypothetical protein